jgi:uncharacterized repeat protein (TIGR01451 family)
MPKKFSYRLIISLIVTLFITLIISPVNASAAYQLDPNADLLLQMIDLPDPVVAGFGLRYGMRVTNNGPDDTTAVVLVSTLPTGTTFDTASSGCNAVGQVVTCDLGDLTVTQFVELFIDVIVDANTTGPLNNPVTVSSALPDLVPDNNSWNEITNVNVPPGIPTPLSPANGSTITNAQPILSWTSAPGAVSYEVALDIINPPSAVYTGYNVGTTFKPPVALYAVTYYWAVRGVNSSGTASPWSAVFSFTLDSTPGSAPARTAFSTNNPTLSWNTVSWAIAYQVEVSRSSSFTNAVITSGVLSPLNLSWASATLGNGVWFWRVRARKPDGTWGPYSAPETFAIIVP